MQEIKIVEYDHTYAEALSDMWSKSSEGWNGENMSRTAQTIIREHDNAFHTAVFLAVKGQEVLGYCSFDQFFHDEGAMYINTLNVRPDYHGQKIGKMLVLQSVKKTVELGWPRVDLFTWPGNLKAVPLYKKCGFFWEKRDDSTHLMNFIPTVLQTEALQDYLKELDWYEDSARTIEVKPDGRKENKFDYLGYTWEKDGRQLRVEFERTGRGMRLIETDAYLIAASVESHELVFGREYSIKYHVVNKSGQPLRIDLTGQNNKNILFDWAAYCEVHDSKTLEGRFFVGEVSEEPDPHKTHPAVITRLLINNQEALFKTGIAPVYPARISLNVPGEECYPGPQALCYLEIQNMFAKPTVFACKQEDREEISFSGENCSISLAAGEKGTIPIPYILHRPLYYCADLTVSAHLEDGEQLTFKKRLAKPFRGRHSTFHGENEEFFEIITGPYYARLAKSNNALQVGSIREAAITWNFPKVGKPFTPELSKRKPDAISAFYEGSSVGFKAFYHLQDLQGVELVMVCLLQPEGFFTRHFELKNHLTSETTSEIWLSDTFNFDFSNGALPYDGKIMIMENTVAVGPGRWNSDKIHENWLFTKGRELARGLCWDENEKIKFDTWNQYFEHNLGKLPAHAAVATQPVELAMGTFNRWQEYRSYAQKKTADKKPAIAFPLQLLVNEGNPFVGKEYLVCAREHREEGKEISFSLTSEKNLFPPQAASDRKEACFQAVSLPTVGWDLLNLISDNGLSIKKQQSVVFRTGDGTVDTHETEEAGKTILSVKNEHIKIMACPELSYSLLSMQYKGEEWLDASFPHITSKAWWNPWVGGITPALAGASTSTLLAEPRKAEFTCLQDSKGNQWKGIHLTIDIEAHEPFKGLQINQYFLLLPSAPVVCCVTGLRQQTGRYLDVLELNYECFLKPDDLIQNCRVTFEHSNGEEVILKAGGTQYFMASRKPLLYESDTSKEKLLVYADPEEIELTAGVGSQLMMTEVISKKQVKHGETVFFAPVFFIFTPQYFKARQLQDLANLRFVAGER